MTLMKKALLLSLVITLSACSLDPEDQKVSKNSLQAKNVQTIMGAVGTQFALEDEATFFTLFLWPEQEEGESDQAYRKRLNHVSLVVSNESKVVDRIEASIYRAKLVFQGTKKALEGKIAQLDPAMTDLEKKLSDLGCEELEPGVDPAKDEQCKALKEKHAELKGQKKGLQQMISQKEEEYYDFADQKIGEKGLALRPIQAILDKDPDEPENWLLSDDGATDSILDFNSRTPEIELTGFGAADEVTYDTESKGIRNLKVSVTRNIVYFEIHEMDEEEEFTGNYYELDLSVAPFLDYVRLAGPLIKKNKNGKVLRRGRAKIDLKQEAL
jgi:hypothetical protein